MRCLHARLPTCEALWAFVVKVLLLVWVFIVHLSHIHGLVGRMSAEMPLHVEIRALIAS